MTAEQLRTAGVLRKKFSDVLKILLFRTDDFPRPTKESDFDVSACVSINLYQLVAGGTNMLGVFMVNQTTTRH